ncbi:murein hydrolase activator EnvC family protein [Rhizobium halophytocola]
MLAVLLCGLPVGQPTALAQDVSPDAAPAASQTSGETSADPAPDEPAPDDPAQDLKQKRDEAAEELRSLSSTMTLSEQKQRELQEAIANIEKSSASLRQALIDSAARRKALEARISDSEEKLATYRVREDEIRHSFRDRRGLLAEVLAALERMGRDPPPALLVTPEDALASVRTAILLGAVVPGVRKETEKLAADLQELVTLRKSIADEKTNAMSVLASRQEEERRMDMLLAENARQANQTTTALASEQRRADELAGKATSLKGLIGSLETEISSVREAMRQAEADEARQRESADERRRELEQGELPDKNRIAPAYLFADLKGKLELPAAGEVLRRFGDPDGTGHGANGMTVATAPGAVVTAPADGWVVFAGEFRSYGHMVILNTGSNYHVVLSGLDRVTTSQGRFVVSGEPVATMGEKRVASATALALETDRPTLYIEFRKDGQPVDSRPWWAGQDAGKAGNGT